jgi:hypothetical protein
MKLPGNHVFEAGKSVGKEAYVSLQQGGRDEYLQ